MKTVKYFPANNWKIRNNGKEYKDDDALPDGIISEEEIARLLKRGQIRKIEFDDEKPHPANSESEESSKKHITQMNKEELIAEAQRLGVQFDETMTNVELRDAIREAMKV